MYLRGNLRVRLATQRKSLRKFNLRPLAGPFGQGFKLHQSSDIFGARSNEETRNLRATEQKVQSSRARFPQFYHTWFSSFKRWGDGSVPSMRIQVILDFFLAGFNPSIERGRLSLENDLESNRSNDTDSFDVILAIHLFVLWVRAIITRSKWQQHHVLSSGFLQGQGHGNTSALAGHVRINPKHYNGKKQPRYCVTFVT